MGRRRVGECVYCGTYGELEIDHIPPQCLFGEPRPSDLIRVPSCRRCNGDASKDDEYFKTALVLKDRAGSHPEAVKIRASVLKALRNPKKARFARYIARRTRAVSLRTPSGLYVGRRLAEDVDLVRLDRVVSRITKGLFWHHHGLNRLPDGFEVDAFCNDGFRGLRPSHRAWLQRTIVAPVLEQPFNSIGRGAMRYWYVDMTDLEHASAWIFEFYGDVRFLALTLPRSE